MNKLKLIPLLYLLLILIIGAVLSVASAQTAPSMRTAIQNVVPTQDVYCDGNYPLLDISNYACPRVPASGNLSAIPAGVVDWVLLELRAVTGSSTAAADAAVTTIVARKPAFLLSNGRVVDAELYAALETANQDPTACTALTANDNCPDVEFNEGDIATVIEGTELYLVIRHRNHLDVISSTRLMEDSGTAGVYAYDFTSAATSALGGASALVEISTGAYAMYGGDADGNGNVNLSDYNNVLRDDIRGSQSGYLASDTDMNINANLSDYNNIVRDNTRASRGTQVP